MGFSAFAGIGSKNRAVPDAGRLLGQKHACEQAEFSMRYWRFAVILIGAAAGAGIDAAQLRAKTG
jgi:hypothetical protein